MQVYNVQGGRGSSVGIVDGPGLES
jgi:hypothetical protein